MKYAVISKGSVMNQEMIANKQTWNYECNVYHESLISAIKDALKKSMLSKNRLSYFKIIAGNKIIRNIAGQKQIIFDTCITDFSTYIDMPNEQLTWSSLLKWIRKQ